MLKRFFAFVLISTMLGFSACQQAIPKEALQLSHESLKDRKMQSRKFATKNEKALLSASAQVMQDIGFTIDESEMPLGVIVASKDASAVNGGQIAGAIMMAALFGASMPIDDHQKIRVSTVTRPSTGGMTNLRVTFQRIVWDNHGNSRAEFLNDPEMYKNFFSKLSKSVFLTAQKI